MSILCLLKQICLFKQYLEIIKCHKTFITRIYVHLHFHLEFLVNLTAEIKETNFLYCHYWQNVERVCVVISQNRKPNSADLLVCVCSSIVCDMN